MNLTEKLRDYRKRKNLTQLQMAEKMGITQAHYSRLEKNPGNLSVLQLETIAKILAIESFDLLFDHFSGSISKPEDQLYHEKLKVELLTLEKRFANYELQAEEFAKLFFTVFFDDHKKEIYDRFKSRDTGDGLYIYMAGDSSKNWIKPGELYDFLVDQLGPKLKQDLNLDLMRRHWQMFFQKWRVSLIKNQEGKILMFASRS